MRAGIGGSLSKALLGGGKRFKYPIVRDVLDTLAIPSLVNWGA
jgi:hypothetical protein